MRGSPGASPAQIVLALAVLVATAVVIVVALGGVL
jgi:hypothetical protein